MEVKLFLAIGAVISIIYGIGFILAPGVLLTLYGIETDAGGVLGFRYFGLTLLTVGLAAWIIKESHDVFAIRGLLLSLVVGNIIGVIVSLWGTLTGIMSAVGWSAVLIYLVLLLAYGYFLFLGARQPATTV
jgi:hypothetical protein